MLAERKGNMWWLKMLEHTGLMSEPVNKDAAGPSLFLVGPF